MDEEALRLAREEMEKNHAAYVKMGKVDIVEDDQ